MSRLQIILTAGGALLVVLLYQLPRVVVENEEDAEVATHDFSVSDVDAQAIGTLKELLAGESNQKNINFADSLARYYLKYGFLDSAVTTAETYLLRDSSLSALLSAADILYAAFERSANAEKAADRARQARTILEKLREIRPKSLPIRNRLAMTLVTTETPMAGIRMLQEVVAEDPDNREALVNLGLLSIRSGQYDKAVGRFKLILEKDPTDFEAMLYLGVSQMELSQTEQAKILFEKIVEAEDVDPAIKASAAQYLQRN